MNEVSDRGSIPLGSTTQFHGKSEITEIRLLVNLYWLRGVFVSCNYTYNQMVNLLKPRILTHTCTFWFYPVRKTRDHVFALVTQGISHAKFTHFLRFCILDLILTIKNEQDGQPAQSLHNIRFWSADYARVILFNVRLRLLTFNQ